MAAAARLRENAVLLDALGKPPQRRFQRFALSYDYFRQAVFTPLPW
jgi:hypothetical protein